MLKSHMHILFNWKKLEYKDSFSTQEVIWPIIRVLPEQESDKCFLKCIQLTHKCIFNLTS